MSSSRNSGGRKLAENVRLLFSKTFLFYVVRFSAKLHTPSFLRTVGLELEYRVFFL